MNAAFFSAVRTIFSGSLEQGQVDGINAILSAWKTYGDSDDDKLAYLLATAKWETAHTMEPVREAYWLSEDWRRRNLRYYPYYGRGFVQLTWERNYQDWAERTGLDLVSKPDLVMEPKLAARILVQGCLLGTFTGKKLGDYIDDISVDFKSARWVVNGTDHAADIAKIAVEFSKAISAGRKAAIKPEPAPSAPPSPPDVEPVEPQPAGGVWSALVNAILSIFRK